jgi:hypothetical protein
VPGIEAKCEINRGSACDNFLTSTPALLDAEGWDAQIATWQAAGKAVECTDSGSLSEIKASIEKLCSKYPCTQEQKTAVKFLEIGLEKMLAHGQRAKDFKLQ